MGGFIEALVKAMVRHYKQSHYLQRKRPIVTGRRYTQEPKRTKGTFKTALVQKKPIHVRPKLRRMKEKRYYPVVRSQRIRNRPCTRS